MDGEDVSQAQRRDEPNDSNELRLTGYRDRLRVRTNGVIKTFAIAGVDTIHLLAGEANDVVSVDIGRQNLAVRVAATRAMTGWKPTPTGPRSTAASAPTLARCGRAAS